SKVFWRRAGLPGRFRFTKRYGVNAEPEAGRRRAIGEHMPQVRVADVAVGLDALHAVARVGKISHDVGGERRREARPPRAAVELVGRVEQRRVAADAMIAARSEQPAHLRAEGPFGALSPRDIILLVGQGRAPFRVALLDAPGRRNVPAP